MRLSPEACRRLATAADHGILATRHPKRGVDGVPACFVLHGELVAVPIDRVKPKAGRRLGRVANLERDPRASLVVEHWDATDWSKLWWVRLALERSAAEPAAVAEIEAALRRKYPQYEGAAFEAVLVFRIVELAGWAAR